MQILKNRTLTILLIALIVSALPIMYTLSDCASLVLFVIALTIILSCANSTAKKQGETSMWVDAEWHSSEENNPKHTHS